MIRVLVAGFGKIGTNVAELLAQNRQLIKERHNLEFRIVCAVDTSGAAIASEGLDLETLINVKKMSGKICDYPVHGIESLSVPESLDRVDAEIFLELTSGDLATGMPGIDNMLMAMNNGLDLVTTNKTSLARGFGRLDQTARKLGVKLKFEGAAHMTIPSVDLDPYRDLGVRFLGIEGVVNATSNYVLSALSEGLPMIEAIEKAQAMGLAERDPHIDLDGWDTACKMVILANSLFHAEATLENVKVSGIADLTSEEILFAKRKGCVIKAVGEIEIDRPISIRSIAKEFPLNHFFATVIHSQKGMIFHTSVGDVSVKTEHAGPHASALAIIHNMIDIAEEKKFQ